MGTDTGQSTRLGRCFLHWVAVGFFQGDKPKRVIGECWDEDKPHLAIDDALKTIKADPYAYKHEYKPER